MRMWIAWTSEMPMGGGEPGQGMDNWVKPEDERGLGHERNRSVAGGVDIGGVADPGRIRGDVSYVNDPPENIVGRVGAERPVSLTEGGDYSVGAGSEAGSDTGGPGGEQAGGASNTGGTIDDAARGL